MPLLAYIPLAVVAAIRCRWWLLAYLLAAPIPYEAARLYGIAWPTGAWLWWVAAAHVSIVAWTCWDGLDEGHERAWLMLFCGLIGSTVAGIVAAGGLGGVIVGQDAYWILTGSCAIAAGMGIGAGSYLWAFKRRGWAPALAGIYFLGDTVANGLYRLHPYRPGWGATLAAAVDWWHLAVALTVLSTFVGSGRPAQRNPTPD